MEFAPKASETGRGAHPDLDPTTGELLDDVEQFPNPVERDHNRRMADPAEREHFMQRVANYQSRLPEGAQKWVGGRDFGSTPYQGFREYEHAIQAGLAVEAAIVGATDIVTDIDIADMTLSEYDRYFNADGTPKDGIRVHLMRGKALDSGRPT